MYEVDLPGSDISLYASSDEQKLLDKIQSGSITYKSILFNFFVPILKVSANSIIYKKFVKENNTKTIKTDFGTVQIRNRLLTEKHRDIINAILLLGETTWLPGGELGVYFKERDILKKLRMGNGNYMALRESILLITDAKYYITLANLTFTMGIFKEYTTVTKNGKTMQCVVFDKKYVDMHKHDFSASFNKLLEKTVEIKYSTIPTIINYIYIHNKDKSKKIYKLMDILEKIGFPIESRDSIKTLKRNLLKFQETMAQVFSIYYNSKEHTFTYARSNSVDILPPLNTTQVEYFINKEVEIDKKKQTIESIVQSDLYIWKIKTDLRVIEFNAFKDDLITYLNEISK